MFLMRINRVCDNFMGIASTSATDTYKRCQITSNKWTTSTDTWQSMFYVNIPSDYDITMMLYRCQFRVDVAGTFGATRLYSNRTGQVIYGRVNNTASNLSSDIIIRCNGGDRVYWMAYAFGAGTLVNVSYPTVYGVDMRCKILNELKVTWSNPVMV